MQIQTFLLAVAVSLAGCGSSKPSTEAPPAGEPAKADEPPKTMTDRRTLSKEECEAQGGAVVGDIGDGATLRPDYSCPSGKPPLGNITPPERGPVPVEGAVCCPQ